MFYPVLLAVFALFTVLDALVTAVGIRIGLIELNPIVLSWGIPLWVIFRILLMVCMVITFFFGYKFISKHFPVGTQILRAALIILDVYIATVVFSGFLAIFLQLQL